MDKYKPGNQPPATKGRKVGPMAKKPGKARTVAKTHPSWCKQSAPKPKSSSNKQGSLE